MPKKTYNDGDTVYAPLINKLNNIQFVEIPNDDGQLPLLLDDAFSNLPTAIKPTVKNIAGEFSILSVTGRTVQYQGGSFGTTALVAVIPNGSIVVPASTTSWVWIDDTTPTAPIVAVATTLPTTGLLIGRFVTSATAITSFVPLYSRARAQSPGASLNSPAFTGTPTAPTPPSNNDSTRLATTAMVQALRPKVVVRASRSTDWNPSGGFVKETYYVVPFNAISGAGLDTGGIFTVPSLLPFGSRDILVIAKVRLTTNNLSKPNINAKLSLFGNGEELAVIAECAGRGVLVFGGTEKVNVAAGDLLTVRIYINPANGDPDNATPNTLFVSGSNSSKILIEI